MSASPSGTPPLKALAVTDDATGAALRQALIWAGERTTPDCSFTAFRKRFIVPAAVREARLAIFADVRYLLWINGQYVSRGPARFVPTAPEYDVIDIARYLHAGENVIATVVMASASNGKMMLHVPGLAERIEAQTGEPAPTIVQTDATWKWSRQTRYGIPLVNWGNVLDRIDATKEDGDWTQPGYDDSKWSGAESIAGTAWGPLTERRIPLLREMPVEPLFAGGVKLPITLTAGQKLAFHLDRMIQAYTSIELDAAAGSRLNLDYAGITYTARGGPQSYISSDTHGIYAGGITVVSGTVTLRSLRLIERLYPFDCAGSFHSSDPFLDRLWSVCARSCQLLSEDSYVDCADRERTEWMDDDPPGFDITRSAMCGPGPDGKPLPADPRLLAELLRRTALTLQPEGWVKAHTCSDRFDIHAKMEDRACDWVEGARRYYDSTGNKALIREIWPAVEAQLKYFLDRRTSRGLVLGRDWEVWGNPTAYLTFEAAGLNAFVYGALRDASYLAGEIGSTEDAITYAKAAQDLADSFNKELWDDKLGTYYTGYWDQTQIASPAPASARGHKLNLPLEGNLVVPDFYAALFALDQGLAPAGRSARVIDYLMANRSTRYRVMTYYYLFKQLYAQDTPALDREVLDTMRKNWKGMAGSPWQCSWEEFYGGSKAHIYGMFPGWFLSSYVLGVRLDGPAGNHRLLIEPRLGDLSYADGKVVTELGVVPVSWKRDGVRLTFQVDVPENATAMLHVPVTGDGLALTIDGAQPASRIAGHYIGVFLRPGHHEGSLAPR
jgi:hypothetical protein